jgi:hypothetical protein
LIHERRARRSRVHKQQESLLTRADRRDARLAVELANLADYNAPPKARRHDNNSDSDSQDDEPKPQPRRARGRKPVKGSRIEKRAPKPKTRPTKKRTTADRLLAEAAQLTPWFSWPSEEEESSSDEEDGDGSSDEQKWLPRTHSRRYPPKQAGVQNIPWSSLPAELRNTVYEYCMANEEEKILNVVHYPNGVPRRSVRGISASTNFAHSYWGFTQTCRRIRNEFTWWLLEKRNVRTPLATLNDYVETFHRPHPKTGKRMGRIEPFCTEAPLRGNGVEILELLKMDKDNETFRLQLTPTNVSPEILALQLELNPDQFDELSIFKDIGQLHNNVNTEFADIGIQAIRISSAQQDVVEDVEEDPSHEILLTLDIGTSSPPQQTRDEHLRSLGRWLFQSKVAEKANVKIQASFGGGKAKWVVRRENVVDVFWRETKKGGRKTFRRYSLADPEECRVEEEDL